MPTMTSSTSRLSELDRTIIRRMVECNQNMAEVARRENYSHGTIRYHVRKIKKITGCDLCNPMDAVKLYEEYVNHD